MLVNTSLRRLVKVWLDDLRPAPAGWVHVMTVGEAIALLESGEVEELSLDHDLGLVGEQEREQTGYDVLTWIEQRVVTHGFVPPKLSVHSANPPAHERMLRAIESIGRRSVEAFGDETSG
jgi:hypothetical protein